MIKKNSTATFIFTNNFADQDEALDWLYEYTKTGLTPQLDLEVIVNLNDSKIIIERNAFDIYYHITFTDLYDVDGTTPLRFSCICRSHFKDIVEPNNVD